MFYFVESCGFLETVHTVGRCPPPPPPCCSCGEPQWASRLSLLHREFSGEPWSRVCSPPVPASWGSARGHTHAPSPSLLLSDSGAFQRGTPWPRSLRTPGPQGRSGEPRRGSCWLHFSFHVPELHGCAWSPRSPLAVGWAPRTPGTMPSEPKSRPRGG